MTASTILPPCMGTRMMVADFGLFTAHGGYKPNPQRSATQEVSVIMALRRHQ